MFTDMVGYTGLSQRNESLAMKLLEEHRQILRPFFPRSNGREVKTMGDAFLVEFSSALEAVRCGFEIQQALHEFNSSRPIEKEVLIRIGVHVGDVIHSQDDVLGDAVNVASRIEPLAEPGGICVSQQVFDHVMNKTDTTLAWVGEVALMNVWLPLAVYKVVLPWMAQAKGEVRPSRDRVAVLPFVNISPDPADEYFADGMTEELIDRLSQVKQLKVLARTSVMSYKKMEKKVSEIARELKVGTIVEGSVRKAANKIRVTVQLINADSEEHLWSERYDKELDDIFGVQTDIASRIASSLAGALVVKEAPRLAQKDTEDMAAYSHFLRGRQLLNEGSAGSIGKAMSSLEKAIELDPSFARAYASLAGCYLEALGQGLVPNEEAHAKARAAIQKALGLDPDLADAHEAMAYLGWNMDDYRTAEAEARKAIELNPNLAVAYTMYGTLKATWGYPEEAIRLWEKALLLDPMSHWAIRHLGLMYSARGRKQEAEAHWIKNLGIAPFDCLLGAADGYLNDRNFEKTDDTTRSLEAEFPDQMQTVALRGELEALRGIVEGAEKAIGALGAKYGGKGLANHYIGIIRYLLGDMDGFFEAMLLDVKNHALNPFPLRYWPLLEEAREDPRYREVMLKNGLDPDMKE